MKKISFVVPVFNEEENIHEFHRRLTQVMAPLPYDYEILFIDDGSRDRTSLLIRELAEKDPHVQGYVFARNFGHQLALTCGLDQSTGDAVISMDGDLQHPPEMVPDLLKKWEEGYEIVQTVRKSTEDATWFKSITSRLYYKLINSMSEVRITPGGSDFRLMDRKAVDALNRFRERARFIRGMVNNAPICPGRNHGVFPGAPASGSVCGVHCRAGQHPADRSCHLCEIYRPGCGARVDHFGCSRVLPGRRGADRHRYCGGICGPDLR